MASEEELGTATVAVTVAKRLAAAGIRHAFVFPGGGSNLELLEAFHDAGITAVITHTETGAAFIACATAEVTAAPGLVVVGSGPGIASVVNGVAHAYLDRVPLIVVSDRYTDAEAATSGHQVLDQRRLLAPVVKHGTTLRVADVEAVVDEAIEIALTAPAGPVHLDMPRDLAAQAVTGGDARPRSPSRPRAAADVEALAAALHVAERPLILVGLEANRSVDPADLERLAERLGAAVMTTYKAKGIYPEDGERWAGIVTGGAIERPLIERAGIVLAVGLDPVELLTKPWAFAAPVVSIADSDAPAEYLGARRGLVGSTGALVRALADRLPGTAAGWSLGEIAAVRDATLDLLRLDRDMALPGWRVVEEVMAELPAETTITVDAGAHMFPATWFARPRGPRRFLISNGLATMGFAVPAAIGASLARPGEPVVAFTGDGGMAYHASELETAVRAGARVIVVVLNDSSLSLIRIKQTPEARHSLDFGLTEFDVMAAALGVRGEQVATANALGRAMRRALAADGSTVIDVRISGREYGRTLELIRGIGGAGNGHGNGTGGRS